MVEPKNKFEEKGKEMADGALQNTVPEAVASVFYSLISPKGYPIILTMRDKKESALFDRMEGMEVYLEDAGYQPDIKSRSSGRTGAPKAIETVEGKTCPKCGSPLIYFEAKGKKNIKCSTSKWDYITKTSSGCDYVEWGDEGETLDGGATPKQISFLKEKNLWEEGMTKSEATELIGQALGK